MQRYRMLQVQPVGAALQFCVRCAVAPCSRVWSVLHLGHCLRVCREGSLVFVLRCSAFALVCMFWLACARVRRGCVSQVAAACADTSHLCVGAAAVCPDCDQQRVVPGPGLRQADAEPLGCKCIWRWKKSGDGLGDCLIFDRACVSCAGVRGAARSGLPAQPYFEAPGRA